MKSKCVDSLNAGKKMNHILDFKQYNLQIYVADCSQKMWYVYIIKSVSSNFIYIGSANNLKRRIEEFRGNLIDEETLVHRYKLKETRGWKISNARKELRKDKDWDSYFAKI